MTEWLRAALHGVLAGITVLGTPALASAQDLFCDPGDLEVRAVEFTGNGAFGDRELARAIVTTPSSFFRRSGLLRLPIGTRRCLDTLEFRRDVVRLRGFYRQRGFFKTEVDTASRAVAPGALAVTFRVREGPAAIVDTVIVTGLDSLPRAKELRDFLTPLRGGRFSTLRLDAAIDSVLDRLRDRGYARATRLLKRAEYFAARDRATVEVEFLPGRIARIGEIDFQILPSEPEGVPQIDERTVRRILALNGLREGGIVRPEALLQSQRDLYRLEAYRHVEIGLAPDSLQQRGDSLLTVLVRLSESSMHVARVGAGWGTVDCFRAQGRYTDLNFLGGARRLAVEARVSKLGREAPICDDIRDDPFSQRLNYHGAVTFRPPSFFGTRSVPSLSIYTDRLSEFKAYLRNTYIGVSGDVTREWRPRTPITFAYRVEEGKTEAEAAVFCAVFNRCTFDVINEAQQRGTLHVGSVALALERTDNPVNPEHGSLVRVEARYAVNTGTSQAAQVTRLFGEASLYRRLGTSVLAARLQLGGVLSPGSIRAADGFVPPQERLYAGGPNSVRGYNQNQLGPVVYIVNQIDSAGSLYQALPDSGFARFSPTGGNALAVGNLELRMRSPFFSNLLRWAAFVDVGQVWNRGTRLGSVGDLRITPGGGLRVNTFFGPVRVDVGYNPYPVPSGPAYFVGRLESDNPASPLQLLCVTPGNTLDRGQLPAGQECPSGFTPPRPESFFSRLTPHLSIGHAF